MLISSAHHLLVFYCWHRVDGNIGLDIVTLKAVWDPEKKYVFTLFYQSTYTARSPVSRYETIRKLDLKKNH